ncbi:MAG: hypothetical protein WA749_00620 [Gelidibacter sp.]
MKSYYWFLATLLVLSFGVLYLFFNGVQNNEYLYKADNQSVNAVDSIQKSSVFFRNNSSIANYNLCSLVENGLL